MYMVGLEGTGVCWARKGVSPLLCVELGVGWVGGESGGGVGGAKLRSGGGSPEGPWHFKAPMRLKAT